MAIQFDKHAREANLFISELAVNLGQPNDLGRTGILLRSILHTLRDAISIRDSFIIIEQLPVFLKGVYVDNWKYSEKPLKILTLEKFKEKVKEKQEEAGELEFDWDFHTEELIRIVLKQLSQYISEEEVTQITRDLSPELKEMIQETLLASD